jgi:hypothetical protein
MNLNKIKLNGRYYLDNGYPTFFNGGSGFSFKMKGKSFSLTFDSIPIPGYFYIIVNRNYENKVKVYAKTSAFHYDFSQYGIYLVDIVKANEANDNALKLLDFSVDGELLDFDHKYDKKVMVYGDSTIAGFGILEHYGNASVHSSDSVRDFCYHALYDLNMDADLFSASGYGLVFSTYTSPKTKGIINFINNVAVDKTIKWNDKTPNDLLIISLGCNDNSYISEEPKLREERIEIFRQKYKELTDSELNKNKDLKILIVYGTLNEKQAYYLHEETYDYLKKFYPNLYIHKFNGDSSAISNHAFVDTHNHMAEELKQVIKSLF